ncbi:uncharacterized protein EAF02_010326 [Botrytis sinoallii]|uniref:uncharacterized protein n=1 Tax=Botrytis sinoallii TaxID=1463999 RepID=UPI0019029AE6|nr:uncharacterized protein EAF02_010326 [Botrytis sinoallii]KAF7864358.1 hypothetical protein EAF02_010326 [Botrytis sinoallii]
MSLVLDATPSRTGTNFTPQRHGRTIALGKDRDNKQGIFDDATMAVEQDGEERLGSAMLER